MESLAARLIGNSSDAWDAGLKAWVQEWRGAGASSGSSARRRDAGSPASAPEGGDEGQPSAASRGACRGREATHSAPAGGWAASSVDQKGLENNGGSNHCFLNVAIQAFWNLQSFRRRLLLAPEHPHNPHGLQGGVGAVPSPRPGPWGDVEEDGGARPDPSTSSSAAPEDGAESCCFCALKSVLTLFEISEESTLPPDVLRRALSHVYVSRGRFQLGEMEDATETIEALLDVLHASSVPPARGPGRGPGSSSSSTAGAQCEEPAPEGEMSEAERVEEAGKFGCSPLCIGHEVFGIEYVDLVRCAFCGATQEPAVVSSFVYRVYVAEVLAERGRPADAKGANTQLLGGVRPKLQDVLWRLCQREVAQKCGECNSLHTVFIERWLTQRPFTFMVSLAWPSWAPSREELWRVMSMLQPQLHMEQIFRTERSCTSQSGRAAKADDTSDPYLLRGLICYCGLHYITLFWGWLRRTWFLFDDTCVREEQDWSCIVNLIVSAQYVPTVVFYERMEGFAAPMESLEEFAKQFRELEERRGPPCAVA